MPILKKYRNSILRVIQESGIEPKLFDADDDELGVFVIALQDSQLWFRIRNPGEDYHKFDWRYTRFTPAFNESRRDPSGGYEDEDSLMVAFNEWLDNDIKGYLSERAEPDMWDFIESQEPTGIGTEMSEEDLGTFSEDEKIRIGMSIKELRLVIINNFNPSTDELEAIDNRLEYLSTAVERLNKIDWRGVAIMTVIAIGTALSLDTEKGRLLFDLFKRVFNGLLLLLQ